VTLVSAKVNPYGLSYLFHANSTDLSHLVQLDFTGQSMYLDRNFGLRLYFSERIAKSKL